MINILEYLEHTAPLYADKPAFDDMTFAEVIKNAKSVGSFLAARKESGGVVIFMERGAEMAAAFFGVLYSGGFYVPVDDEMPEVRIKMILENIKPSAVVCSEKTFDKAEKMNLSDIAHIYSYKDLIQQVYGENLLADIRSKALDIDPAYVVFTSGSTGEPKGVVSTHGAVISYIEGLSQILKPSSGTVFGCQVPLYVDACLKELILTIKHGAATHFIPRSLFMTPVRLIQFLNERKINTVCWVSSALSIVAGLGALVNNKIENLHTVAFGSEVLPRKHLNAWREALPEARFINLYGPTEATGMTCFYEVNSHVFDQDEQIPIGKAFPNTRVFLLDGDNKPVAKPGETGEICVVSSRLALGYYNDFEKTNAVFTQCPLNTVYSERMYRTGDLGTYNLNYDIIFLGRIDNLIKHMGHRIELGEIESAACMCEGVQQACCVYSGGMGIILFYTGEADENDVLSFLKKNLQRHMQPGRVRKLDALPYKDNLKVDRKKLAEMK
jgi:amino acid adenylation domain-containing protein